VRLWLVGEARAAARSDAVATLAEHRGDVYSVSLHPTEHSLLSAGYDKTVRLWDVPSCTMVRALHGHELAVRQAVFNATGNLLLSGSKDGSVRFWDARSGLCVNKLDAGLGEVTSVRLSCNGAQLLTSSNDNAIRLWDVRAGRPLRVFKGHLNTSRSFVRARFGPAKDMVLSGSEDGAVHVWDAESAVLVQRLSGHTDVCYDATWSESQCMLASCSHDGTLRTWCYDASQPLVMGAIQHEGFM